MKKKVMIGATIVTMMLASCGFGTTGQMGNGTGAISGAGAGAAIGSVIQSVLGLDQITQKTLIGTWKYSQPGCAFTSEQLLAQAGGEIVASEIKTKMQPTMQKMGIKSSNTQVTFNQDGTFAAKIAGKNWSGNYTFDEKTRKITMTGLLLNVNCYAKRNTDGIALLFEATKLLTLLQTMSTLQGGANGNSTLGTIGDLAKSYDGLRIGFDMK